VRVYVHRDFMPRNLMVSGLTQAPLGVLDFQDAVYGPITYDIASLMRDAFLSWDEEFVLEVTAAVLAAGCAQGEACRWASDFGTVLPKRWNGWGCSAT
jgi:N-acetylmuramate 1-kinase